MAQTLLSEPKRKIIRKRAMNNIRAVGFNGSSNLTIQLELLEPAPIERGQLGDWAARTSGEVKARKVVGA